jgi:hypothetical protein
MTKDQILDLQLVLEALVHSEPKASHYPTQNPEAVERHERAIKKLIAILNSVGLDKDVMDHWNRGLCGKAKSV